MKTTIQVHIKYLAAVRSLTGRVQEEIILASGSTLSDVANWLSQRYSLPVPSPQVMAILNGQGWEQLPLKLSTEVHDGDVICLFPPIAGG